MRIDTGNWIFFFLTFQVVFMKSRTKIIGLDDWPSIDSGTIEVNTIAAPRKDFTSEAFACANLNA